MAYSIDKSVCVGCGSCAESCPVEAIKATEDGKYTIDDACVECGACVANCPVNAISQK